MMIASQALLIFITHYFTILKLCNLILAGNKVQQKYIIIILVSTAASFIVYLRYHSMGVVMSNPPNGSK